MISSIRHLHIAKVREVVSPQTRANCANLAFRAGLDVDIRGQIAVFKIEFSVWGHDAHALGRRVPAELGVLSQQAVWNVQRA